MDRTALILTVAAVLVGCSATPIVTKQRMTLGEANIEGMECRKDAPPDSNIPRTICASSRAWAAFDENRQRETDAILAEGRRNANVGAFNRN